MGAPTPAMAAQMPIARGRSAFGKDVTTTERVAGITHAAPRPMSPRAAITSLVVTLSLNATQAEKDPITTNPTSKVERRPKRSPRAPIIRSDPPKTSAYASKIHCRSALSAPRSLDSSGNATLRVTLLSMTTMRLKPMMARMNQRRGWPSSDGTSSDMTCHPQTQYLIRFPVERSSRLFLTHQPHVGRQSVASNARPDLHPRP